MQSETNQQKDDFWDLSQLTPRPRKTLTAKNSIDLPLISETGSAPAASGIPIPPKKSTDEGSPLRESFTNTWHPSHPLIQTVTLRPWRSSFSYYEDFFHDAVSLRDKKGTAVQHEPFFSYVPQYNQLNAAQMRWYLYWRDCCRFKKQFLPTDESYIILYLYEIINLSDFMDVRDGVEQLLLVWKNYHDTYPVINKYLCEWVVDYCMIHSVDLSIEQTAMISDDMIATCSLKEFFLSFDIKKTDAFSAFLLKNVSSYHYEQSKYYKNEAVRLYDTHVPAVLTMLLEDGDFSDKIKKHLQLHATKIIRDAYVGALCSCNNKRKMDIEYLSFSKSHEIRFIIGDIVKASENCIRANLGIKSRLSLYGLPENVRERITEYFARLLPARRTVPVREDYEKKYDITPGGFSFGNAKQIETSSWETTDRLVSAFDQDTAVQREEITDRVPQEDECGNRQNDVILQNKQYINLCTQRKYTEARQYCIQHGIIEDALIMHINETAQQVFGDVIFENGVLIEDYLQDVIDYVSNN